MTAMMLDAIPSPLLPLRLAATINEMMPSTRATRPRKAAKLLMIGTHHRLRATIATTSAAMPSPFPALDFGTGSYVCGDGVGAS